MGSITFAVKAPPVPPAPSFFTFLMYNAGSGGDQAGVVLETALSQSDLGPDFSYAYTAAMLADQRVVVAGYNTSDSNNEVKCYLAGTTTLDWAYGISGYELYEYMDICVLNNGNIVAFWVDYSDEKPYFIILNSSGGLVQGVTNAETTAFDARPDDGFSITALVDGGFFCKWRRLSSTTQRATLWNANGTNRQATSWLDGISEISPGFQFSSGPVGVFEVSNGYVSIYSETDLSEESGNNVFTGESPTYVYTDKLSTWTDKVAMVFSSGGNIYGTIMDDNGNTTVEDNLILSTADVDSFLALPNGTFLLQFNNAGSEYGQSYYILDSSLDIVSGPHTAFTGLSANANYFLKGAAG